jgi:serine/threonine protein phosphatase 1
MRRIAISDIHGCVKTFRALVEQQVQLSTYDHLYLLGDYIDRGPDSRGVLDYIMQLRDAGYAVSCIKGNHEDMMIKAVEDRQELPMWLYNGGSEALASFSINDPGDIPEKYIRFVKEEMEAFIEVDRYILVHAGLNFIGESAGDKTASQHFLWRMHNPFNDTEAMMWIRWWYEDINWNWLKERIIIHGHTPLETDEIEDMFEVMEADQVLDIDNGCFAKYKPGLGKLCAFDMSNPQLYFQDNID